MEYYIAQIFGIFALITCFISYQTTKKKRFLIVQLITNAFYATQYLILKAYSGFSSCVISFTKNVLFYNLEKRGKEIPIYFLIIFEAAFITGGILTYNGIYSIIPVFIHCVYTFGTWLKDLRITYTIAICSSILWIVYSIIIGAHISILASIFEIIASILGLKKIASERKKETC